MKEEEVRQFIDECKDRFMKMEIDGYMALFSRDAIENRMFPYTDIEEAYRRTVIVSRSISYWVEIHSVQTLKGIREKRVFRGDIQWTLARKNGSLRIRGINYGRGNPLR